MQRKTFTVTNKDKIRNYESKYSNYVVASDIWGLFFITFNKNVIVPKTKFS